MNQLFNTNRLPFLTLGAGGLGFALRLWFFSAGVDDRGLLPENHPAVTLSFILTALFLGVLLLCVRNLTPQKKPALLFPASIPGALGCIAGGAGVVYAILQTLTGQNFLSPAVLIGGLFAVVAFGYLALCRRKHLKPHELIHVVILVFLMFHAVARYRTWSITPQLQLYVFQLFASVFLILHTFYRGSITGKRSSQQWHVFTCQAALFFCCLSLAGDDFPFYLAMGAWTATDLCSLNTGED